MLFYLVHVAKKFSCASSFHFLLFLIVFLKIPRAKVNAKLKPGLAIPTDAPKAVANEAIEVPLIVADKIKNQSNQTTTILFSFIFILFLSILRYIFWVVSIFLILFLRIFYHHL